MNAYIARTAMIPSGIRTAAHADGYDYADYQLDEIGWARMVWDIAGTGLEGYLFLSAASDYRDHILSNTGPKMRPTPRGQYIREHVAGQIDRALEIGGMVIGWTNNGDAIWA